MGKPDFVGTIKLSLKSSFIAGSFSTLSLLHPLIKWGVINNELLTNADFFRKSLLFPVFILLKFGYNNAKILFILINTIYIIKYFINAIVFQSLAVYNFPKKTLQYFIKSAIYFQYFLFFITFGGMQKKYIKWHVFY